MISSAGSLEEGEALAFGLISEAAMQLLAVVLEMVFILIMLQTNLCGTRHVLSVAPMFDTNQLKYGPPHLLASCAIKRGRLPSSFLRTYQPVGGPFSGVSIPMSWGSI